MRATVVLIVVFLRNEPDRDALNKPGLDAMPSLVSALLYYALLVNLRNLGPERQTLFSGRAEFNGAYRLIRSVIQEERGLVLVREAERINRVFDSIRAWR